MRLTKNLLLTLLLIGSVGSCVKQPEYSVIPRISLLDITFRRGNLNAVPAVPDTLIYRIRFADGDGDLGVGGTDSSSFYSYNPWYFVYNAAGVDPNLLYPHTPWFLFYGTTNFTILIGVDNTAKAPTGYKFVNYQAKRTVSQLDTLPPLGCGSWELQHDTQGKVTDTIYIHQNLRAYNINVDVYERNNGGTYDKFDPASFFDIRSCAPNLFRSTFPDLSNDRKTPLDGVITFRIQSYNLSGLFNTKTLKMDITINDRAYNVSNVAEKSDFTLQQITK